MLGFQSIERMTLSVFGDARVWGSIRKYRAKPGADHQDTHNVLGLALDAIEAKCEVLAFSRDIDKDPKRAAAVEAGIALIPKTFAKAPDVIGGVAVPALEAWILALLGHRCSEARNIKETFAAKGVGKKDGPRNGGRRHRRRPEPHPRGRQVPPPLARSRADRAARAREGKSS